MLVDFGYLSLQFADFNKIFSFLQKIEYNKLFRSLTTYF